MSKEVWRGIVCAWVLGLAGQAYAAIAATDVPPALRDWIPWVLDEVPDHACPFLFNGASRQCAWPGRLDLDAVAGGATFHLDVEVYQDAWLPLPGRPGAWPQRVTDHGEPVVVVARQGVPAVELAAGRHRLAGAFDWSRLPESLPVPGEYGLVALTVDGRPLPLGNTPGEVWLRPAAPARVEDAPEERLDVQVFRRLVDDQPFQVVTWIALDVAGAQREVTLPSAQLPDSVPMALEGPLPARLEPNGDLRVQLRPGHWTLQLTTRHGGPVDAIGLPPRPAPWPGEEVWVFDARPALRLVDVAGAPGIDPAQTLLPGEWQQLPAYRVAAGSGLSFTTRRRGDPDPEPDQLHLARELWLDFDGQGMTARDRISGRMTRAWRLDAAPQLALGRVTLNGEPQFVTTRDGVGQGVEVRRGTVDLEADSRVEGDVRSLPAVGWATDVSGLSVTLHLPPGWRLWSATGADNVPDTWLHRWTLLDLFLVLIATVGVARLWHWRAAALAAVTLLLLWHEPTAPRQVWLHLLAAVALLRVLPAGRLCRGVTAYRNVVLLVLATHAVVFMVTHLRTGLYPQLERPYETIGPPSPVPMAADAPATAAMEIATPVPGQVAGSVESDALHDRASRMLAKSAAGPRTEHVTPRRALEQDPLARIQTGPGVPDWRWTAIDLGWNGPVTAAQPLSFVLISPRVNGALALLRVALLAWLVGFLFVSTFGRLRRERMPPVAAILFAIGVLGIAGAPVAHAAFPDPALLDTLKGRLLRAPMCAPACADVPRAAVGLLDGSLKIELEVQAAVETGIPLPGRADQWLPETVLIDAVPATAMRRASEGMVWLMVPPGVHRVTLIGALPARTRIEVPLPLVPQRLEANLAGWAVEGLRPDGKVESQLILTRARPTGDATPLEALAARSLPAYFTVTRTLRLGLDWRVETRIERRTPPGGAATLRVPLLAGESVTTPDIQVTDGHVNVSFAAGERALQWVSVLTPRDTLDLEAPRTDAWSETWRADISPVWHAAFTGIPVVHHQDGDGQWLPEWRPWPGEKVGIALTRPTGVPGQWVTLDRARLVTNPGQRTTDATLEFTLRSSQGGQHALTLPVDAALQSVTIDGVPQPIRQDGRRVTLPLTPGARPVVVAWRSEAGLGARYRTPEFALGAPSVNDSLTVQLPEDRWTLFVRGPRLGPAILFWGVLIVIVLVAVGLARTRLTPLSATQWTLLGIGLSQTDVLSALVVVGWLLALGARVRVATDDLGRWRFNLLQIALAVLTLAALSMLFDAIRHGLLGSPDMQIAGNGSTAATLNWFQDRAPDAYPVATVWSVSLWWYRALMLAWALWLAFALLNWLRWGWRNFAHDGLWRPVRLLPARTPPVTTGRPPPA
ncbi:MAG: hypothetical protein AB7O21_02580 [Gammaproteobacteria bacterium]